MCRHKLRHEATKKRCADRDLAGRVRTVFNLALSGSLSNPMPPFAANCCVLSSYAEHHMFRIPKPARRRHPKH